MEIMMWKDGTLAVLTDSLYIGCGETIAKAGDVVMIAKDKKITGSMSRVRVFTSKENEKKGLQHIAWAEDLAKTTPTDIGKWK
jgi:hypothetical protein